MSESLYMSIIKEKPAIKQGVYWWPQVFEAMRRASFQFYPAGSTTKQGSYFEEEQVACSFEELWDVMYTGHEQILVFFWPTDADVEPFRFDVSVRAIPQGQWQLDITLENGYVMGNDEQQNSYRVQALLKAGLALYELCFPCSLRMYWDEMHFEKKYTDLLQVYPSALEESLAPLVYCDRLLHWKEQAVVQGKHIYVVDPIPAHIWFKGYKFISLIPFAEENDEYTEKNTIS